jgi:YhcH/YjgK/YiaL family protein
MLVDQLENARNYPFGPAWEKVSRFLAELPPDTADGEYRIQGDEIFARVMTYTTRDPEDAVLEAHRDYADVQSVLVGSEAMAWFPTASLTVATPYDCDRDAEFYRYPGTAAARVTVVPGRFVLLLPGDAHMFALAVDGRPAAVKKVVVKVRMALLLPEAS